MTPKVGFIGMGIMGKPMAENLLKSGIDLMVYNRTEEKTGPLKQAGAKVAGSPSQLTRWAEVIMIMVTGPDAVDAILNGPEGVLSQLPEGKTLINMSTVDPAYTQELADLLKQHDIAFIDAPVSGSKKPAEDAALVFLAGGEEKIVNQYEPLLLKMGKKVVYCGEAGRGTSMKIGINLLLGIMMEGLCEAVNFGQRCGFSTQRILDTILSGPLGCGLFNLKTEMIETGEYPAQFPLKHMTKDIRFALQAADKAGAAIPAGNTIFQLYRQGVGHQFGDMDFTAIKKVLETMNDR